MLRLKKIKIADGIAEADYYPEDSEQFGHIVVDLSTEEVISCDEVPGFWKTYPGHAKWHLIRMAKAGETDKERLVMWY